MADNSNINTSGDNKTQIQGGLLSKLAPVKDIPIVQWGFKYAGVVVLICTVLFAFGIYGLHEMDKNEFPPFTVREGVVAAVYPGTTSLEMEQQVLKPLEEFVFSKKEVNKVKTESNAASGIVMIFVELDDNVKDTDSFWNTFTRELETFKSQLPAGVLAVRVISNFGDTSSLLITMESKDKTYRELGNYMDDLKDKLRPIGSVGEMSVYGKQNEQITIEVDPDKLINYGISEKTLAVQLLAQGFNTTGGDIRDKEYTSPIYVSAPLNDVADIADQIILSTPDGGILRVKDVADVRKEYPDPDSYITNNGVKCIMLSISMKPDNNVVKMGEEVEKVLEEFQAELPEDVTLFRITNQPYDVSNSVTDFLRELLIAVVAVIIVIMCLLPIRTAIIAAATIPITIFISLALFYILGIELNTVTLACLIVSLGMIVDNSVVIIDDYVELLGEGMPAKDATLRSASEFYKSIFSATLAISIVFFPFLITMTGMFRDFLSDFPWAMTIILVGSFFIAELLVPYLQYKLIKPKKAAALAQNEQSIVKGKKNGAPRHFSLMGWLQKMYDALIVRCFRYPWLTIIVSLALTVWGAWIFLKRPVELMPIAERNQFAVEIHLPVGSSLEATNAVADSLEAIISKDPRVVSIASFHGCSSPRFQTTYAPQVGGPNYAQFIVNTVSNEATVDVLNEFAPKYTNYFPDAYVRFKQLSYSKAAYPIELHIVGEDLEKIINYSDTILDIMRGFEEISLAMSTASGQLVSTLVEPDYTTMSRLGLSNTMLETSLALRFNKSGLPIATVWDGNYGIPVVVRTNTSERSNVEQLSNQQISVLGFANTPLNQFAEIKPQWNYGQIYHKDGLREVKLMAQVGRGENAMAVTHQLMNEIKNIETPEGVDIVYGGDYEQFETIVPNIVRAIGMAIVIIFFILLFHYKKVKVSILLLLCMIFSLPGAGFGLLIQGGVFSLTCTLGIISLMGILVRNVIIMIDYAQELKNNENLPVKEAILESAKRRMRPIFLTSAAATMGVLPMVLTGSALWKPMGTVIFWGTMITFIFIVTVIPVIYWKVMDVGAKNLPVPQNNQTNPVTTN